LRRPHLLPSYPSSHPPRLLRPLRPGEYRGWHGAFWCRYTAPFSRLYGTPIIKKKKSYDTTHGLEHLGVDIGLRFPGYTARLSIYLSVCLSFYIRNATHTHTKKHMCHSHAHEKAHVLKKTNIKEYKHTYMARTSSGHVMRMFNNDPAPFFLPVQNPDMAGPDGF
jgi:hypothetical protein